MRIREGVVFSLASSFDWRTVIGEVKQLLPSVSEPARHVLLSSQIATRQPQKRGSCRLHFLSFPKRPSVACQGMVPCYLRPCEGFQGFGQIPVIRADDSAQPASCVYQCYRRKSPYAENSECGSSGVDHIRQLLLRLGPILCQRLWGRPQIGNYTKPLD